jgi:hypothetical protein
VRQIASCRVSPESFDKAALHVAMFLSFAVEYKEEGGATQEAANRILEEKINRFKEGRPFFYMPTCFHAH